MSIFLFKELFTRMQVWIIVFGAWDAKFLPGKKSRKNRKNRVKLSKNHVKSRKIV